MRFSIAHLPLLYRAAIAQREFLELRPVLVHETLQLADLLVVERGHLFLRLRVSGVIINGKPEMLKDGGVGC